MSTFTLGHKEADDASKHHKDDSDHKHRWERDPRQNDSLWKEAQRGLGLDIPKPDLPPWHFGRTSETSFSKKVEDLVQHMHDAHVNRTDTNNGDESEVYKSLMNLTTHGKVQHEEVMSPYKKKYRSERVSLSDADREHDDDQVLYILLRADEVFKK
ncbi:MAG: hypothetical protein Q9159_003096 [Coniocarpon cinnabarinum]